MAEIFCEIARRGGGKGGVKGKEGWGGGREGRVRVGRDSKRDKEAEGWESGWDGRDS